MDPERVAKVCHEANRVIQEFQGDLVLSPPWEQAPEWMRAATRDTVLRAQEGTTARELHEWWCEFKTREGWVYGPVKDAERKTHPTLVPFDDLPPEQALKDGVMLAIVRAMSD